MIPRAIALDVRSFGAMRRGVTRAAAYARAHSIGLFVVAHCAIAGAAQLGALLADIERAGRAMPSPSTLVWAWLGLALIAVVPAIITAATTTATPRRFLVRLAMAMGVGAAFYVFPFIALTGTLGPLGTFVPVATLWHAALAIPRCAPPQRR